MPSIPNLFKALALFLALPAVAQEVETLTPSGDPAPIRAVKLVSPEPASAALERSFFGQIVAFETVDLSFEIGGRLTELNAVEGDFLAKDTVIAALDLGPLERAAERARLNLQQADRDLERAQTLAATNTVADVQAENARTARNLADVALREAEEALADATLHAPFNALVASRLAPNFSNVSAGQPIVRLHDMSETRVEIDVPERLFQQTSNPDAIVFSAVSPLFAEPVQLSLREFNAETAAVGQTYRVTLALPDGLNLPTLIPGASMTVVARAAADDSDALILPISAVLPTSERGARVLVFTPDGKDAGTVGWQNIEVSSQTGTEISVRGLDRDTLVVAAGVQMLREGETVRRYTGLTVEE